MSIKDAILAAVSKDPRGEVRGRTLLQKKLYFLQLLTSQDFGFEPHYYGPYSAAVADELGALRDAGFVEEMTQAIGMYNAFGEGRRYVYRPTEALNEALAPSAAGVAQYYEALAKINGHAIADDPRLLAAAAKVHFIVAESGKASLEEIRDRGKALGWSLDAKQISQVVEYLRLLNLVKPG